MAHRDMEIADAIADIAHRGQTRMDGVEPFVNHPRRVAESLTQDGVEFHVYAAALLHDVLEDSDFTSLDLLKLGVSVEAVQLVVVLTRTEGESYNTYIDRVLASPEARLIKLADATDNLNSLPEGHGLRRRYERTIARCNEE